MDEIFGWFPQESQDALDRLIKEHNIKTVIEIGCFVGKSTAFIAERVDHVTVVDTFIQANDILTNGDATQFPQDFQGTFEHNMKAKGVWDKIDICRMTAHEAALLGLSADLIYIDASHDFGNVLRDLQDWSHAAKFIVCGDDYDDNWPGVKHAVDRFHQLHAEKPKIEGRFWYKVKR